MSEGSGNDSAARGGDASSGERDRLRRVVAYAIVSVSILGALVSWRASQESQRAGGFDAAASQEQLRKNQAELGQRSLVGKDLSLVGPLQERWLGRSLLGRDARTVRARDTAAARSLVAEARNRTLEAATAFRAFVAGRPELRTDGTVGYSQADALKLLEDSNTDAQQLSPERTRALARSAHAQSATYVAVAALLAAVLFFLTLSQVTGRGRRELFAAMGGVLVIVAAFLFVLA